MASTISNNNTLALSTKMQEIKQLWGEYNQEQVFNWNNKLDNSQLASFLEELQQIDVEDVSRIYKNAVSQEELEKNAQHNIKPFANVATIADSTAQQRKQWEQVGLNLIANNKVGVLLLAGGQASRLGAALPKGMYDIGLPSGKSLYQMQVERSICLTKMAARAAGKDTCAIPWYIMTSPATYAETVKHFRDNNFFGLPESNFFFFNQHTQPCLTPEGKIISESAGHISTAPNGNGGLYKAMHTSGALEDMQNRGLEYISQYCVDNCLIRVADPMFVGYMHEMKADCAAKVVPKAYPEEQVGVMAYIDGKAGVVEYSEITPAMRNLRDHNGTLVYNYSHICINNFAVSFLKDIAENHLNDLPFHIAKKKIAYANEDGEKTTALKENGWKMEMFIFDAFAYARNMVAFECEREDEFSPLKNGPGAPKDSPETCLADISRLYAKYLRAAGATLDMTPNGADCSAQPIFEVSPLLTYAGEGLESYVKNKTFSSFAHIAPLQQGSAAM